MKWIVVPENVVKVDLFVKKLLLHLGNCFHNIQSNLRIRRENMFPCHHLLGHTHIV